MDNETDSSERTYTVIIVGNNRVGKSSIIQRHFEQDYNAVYFPTQDMYRYVTHTKSYGQRVKLIVWDINGNAISVNDKNNEIKKISNLASQAKGIFFVYDVCNEKSFLDIAKWITSMDDIFYLNTQKTLLGNKSDKWKERAVSKDMGQAMANLHQMRFFETSASSKADTNIKSAIYMMVHDIRKEYDKDFAMKFEIEEDQKKTKVSRRKRLSKLFKCLPCGCCGCKNRRSSILKIDSVTKEDSF